MNPRCRVSDWVIDRIAREGVGHVFMVSGGSAMYLVDSLGRRSDIRYVCNHHEQAAAMAADAYARVTGNLGVALVTTGPAGTNVITGLMCAWTDSVPMLVLSGQCKTASLIGDTGLRQRGFHEANITKIVESITKYAVTVREPDEIAFHLEKAIFLAKKGRPGPVWIDVPLDVQGAMVDPAGLRGFEDDAMHAAPSPRRRPEAARVAELLARAKRPVVLAGHGVRLAGKNREFLELIELVGAPVVTSRNGFDLVPHAHPLRAGFVGNYGQRAANFTVQNADLVVSIGSRLTNLTVGYEPQLFAREAVKVVVDIDPKQLEHCLLRADLLIEADLRAFVDDLVESVRGTKLGDFSEWRAKVRHWQSVFPNVTPAMRTQERYVNPYFFYEVLSQELPAEVPLVWDQGAAYHCAAVAFETKSGQRAFSADGFTPMGYGLPAAIGAAFALGKRPVACVHGDGGLQLNVQELQTIWHHQLPIKLFVFSNDGYTSIKHTQQQYFDGHFVGADSKSGLSCPDTLRVAEAFRLPSRRVETHGALREAVRGALDADGPYVVDISVHPLQAIAPRTRSERLPDGRMVSKPLEDMWPYLDRKTFYEEMIVKPVS